MNNDDRLLRRWAGMALGAALLLGACGSSAPDDASSASDTEVPSELALDASEVDSTELDSTEVDSTEVDSTETADGSTTGADDSIWVDDFQDLDLSPEGFEELKTDPASRAALLVEMGNQGLDAQEAECFLDNVSADLFMTFGAGDQPSDAQFGDLLELLDTCQIAFGAES